MKTDTRPPVADMAFATMLCGLRRQREKAGLSQAAAAQALHISRQSYWAWENMRACPSASNLIAILNLFGCTLSDLTEDPYVGSEVES
ncbi:MAG: helix-turn-helix transcriptional regulator [Oscillospiraceae bacterium]|nr:helix-turn-helix transcriptional regulator [Oscillospiraceae bacterium]